MATPSIPGVTKAPSWWDPQHPFVPDIPKLTPATGPGGTAIGSTLVGPANSAVYKLANGQYYVPSSWGAGGGGQATMSAAQAAALGGTPSGAMLGTSNFLDQGTKDQYGNVANAPGSGYLFSSDPSGSVAAGQPGVSYKPGTGGKAATMAPINAAATAALPAIAMFAPELLPMIMGEGAAAQGALMGGIVGSMGENPAQGLLTGAALGAAGGGLSQALGGTPMVPTGTASASGGISGPWTGSVSGIGGSSGGLSQAALDVMQESPLTTAPTGSAPAYGGVGTPGAGAGTDVTDFYGSSLDPSSANYVMPGADATTSGAPGGLSSASPPPAAPGGSTLTDAAKWALAHPQLIAGGIGAIGSLLGSHGTPGGGSGAAGGVAAAGKPLPYVAPLSRTVTPYTGDQLKYGQSSQTGGEHNFFGTSPNAIPHASGGALPSRHASGPGGGRDDLIDAKVADGEFIFSSDVVSALGDGSNDEGAKRLEEAVRKIRARRNAGGTKLPPKARSPLDYMRTR